MNMNDMVVMANKIYPICLRQNYTFNNLCWYFPFFTFFIDAQHFYSETLVCHKPKPSWLVEECAPYKMNEGAMVWD